MFGSKFFGNAYFGRRYWKTSKSDYVITSTSVLQNPVDCVMAGNQREFKKGRAHYRALRGIFRE